MMEGYHWVNATSGTDLFTYLVYQSGGFFGLALAGALVNTFIYYFFAKAVHMSALQRIVLFPLLIIVTRPYTVISFRGQLLSLGFLAILTWILLRAEQKYKTVTICPLIFWIWANVHGQIIIGFAVFTIWLVFRILTVLTENPKNKNTVLLTLFLSYLLSWLLSLVNPYGAGTILEPLLYIGNQNIHAIAEWTPYPFLSIDWKYLVISSLFLIFAAFRVLRKNKMLTQLPWVIIAFLLLGFALAQRRYAWMYYFMTLPLLITVVPQNITFIRSHIEHRVIIAICLLLLGFGLFSSANTIQAGTMNWITYCKVIGCSEPAAVFLLEHRWQAPLLTIYNWGGWLIWRYPAIKPSIDGRMSLWRSPDGYSAFSEYYSWEQNITDVDKSPYNTVLTPTYKPIYNRLQELVREGTWKLIYEDANASIFARTK